MQPVEFLQRVTPKTGIKFIATLGHNSRGFVHKACDTHAQAAAVALQQDKKGRDVYFALNSFQSAFTLDDQGKKHYRVGASAIAARAFWFDLDVHATKPNCYASQLDAVRALKAFVEQTGLPRPMWVSSGYGIHVYWPLTADITIDQWHGAAMQLKALAVQARFLTDPARTTDRSSVLRVVGTHNYKRDGKRVVQLLGDGGDVEFEAFVDCLAHNGYAPKPIQTPPPKINVKANLLREFPPSFEVGILTGCGQMRALKEKGGNVTQPYWYAGLQLLRHVEGGESLKESYSNKHPDFTPDETDQKWQQLVDGKIGPTLCSHFEEANRGGCDGCAHRSKISSPIELGRGVHSEPAATTTTVEGVNGPETKKIHPPPWPYKRSPAGITIAEKIRKDLDAEDGKDGKDGKAGETVDVNIYDHDFYAVNHIYDEARGGLVTNFEVLMSHESPKQFSVPGAVMHDRKAIVALLGSVGILPVAHNVPKVMAYMLAYITEIQRLAAAQKQYAQMGWHNDDEVFVNGPIEYHASGKVENVGMSEALVNSAKGMRSAGNLEVWKKIFNTYARPGFEPHAFAALSAFGAPIFKFSGYAGIMLNMVGETGSGKSTVLRLINSVYGTPDDAMLQKDDTIQSVYHRMGIANNLPVTLDEVTNFESEALSAMCYNVSAGRGRNRLKQDATERSNLTSWKTIVVSTSNTSLIDKLASLKSNSSPEAMRLFEYQVDDAKILSKEEASAIFSPLTDHYGHAGHVYLQYITQNLPEVKQLMEAHRTDFDRFVQAAGRERYWSSLVASNIVGGIIAKRLGLHDFDINLLLEWVVGQVRSMRINVTDNTRDPVSVLSGFLNKSHINTLFVKTSPNARDATVVEAPRGPFFVRSELWVDGAKSRRWVYMSVQHFKAFCGEYQADYNRIRKTLLESRVIMDASVRYVLGRGTHFTGGQTLCWLVDADHEKMGGLNLRLVDEPLPDLETKADVK